MAATASAAQFNLRIKTWGKRAEERHAQFVRAVALRALRGLVLSTRYDTGRMRGNWQVTEKDPATGFNEDARDTAGGTTIQKGSAVIAGATGKQMIWAHNGVPYAKYVNEWDKIVEATANALRTWLAAQRNVRTGPEGGTL